MNKNCDNLQLMQNSESQTTHAAINRNLKKPLNGFILRRMKEAVLKVVTD